MIRDYAVPIAGIVVLALYAAACWWWPFAKCGKCKGLGRFMSPGGRHWRNCPRCKGSGRRIRTGRRLINVVIRAKREAE